ncbi:MAG TPA: bifunctional phosphoribosylaminoimidazolecarboxamide formyltransferase/inosine monophosphate cyclohydrolase [Elusimicrobia bacterium]|nr:bifunctional phosphoribosylaminoimidazolecarboxamide formyltransferase/inosine monophosphate cyclohydrolase [Elusimicrobiota bacterium]
MKNIAVFASGEGTNLQAMLDAVKNGRINGKVVLAVSSLKGAGALARAEKENIPAFALPLKDFASGAEHDARLAGLCEEYKIDLVCLAGYMLKLGPRMLAGWQGKIINIHPALLPAFGGKGFYGMKVHEAVINSGAAVSGATAHFVSEDYDRGPIILQAPVNVLSGDTPEVLAKRVNAMELTLYPKAAALFCDDRLKIEGNKVLVLPANENSRVLKRALLSLSDKTGAVDFARALTGMGVEIISTSGTYKLLKEAGLPVRALETLTGFPEILDGRVKTLHPLVHGGILYRRDNPVHAGDIKRCAIEPIDLVAVNLYPFEETAKKAAPWSEELIENIDIGGVALLRAAAKNYQDVAVVSNASDYAAVIKNLKENGGVLPLEFRKELALKAFKHTAAYDTAIAGVLVKTQISEETPAKTDFAPLFEVRLNKINDLRYGENPHQSCALYSKNTGLPFDQLQGKELSYNNILDAYGACQAVLEFSVPAAVILKHVTPCGMGTGIDLVEAFERAWNTDPLSAFGGIVAVNRKLDGNIADFLSKKFVEVICAPDYDDRALAVFAKKTNLRLLKWRDFSQKHLVLRSVGDEVLVSSSDSVLFADKWEVPTLKKPSKEEETALKFAWTAAKYVRSNAIVLAGPGQTVGIGAGQMSRVDAVFMARHKYEEFLKNNQAPKPLVLASDAFFPFPDGIEEAAKAGVTAVVQPGGSVRDKEVVAAADRLGLAMVMTGIRHFRH